MFIYGRWQEGEYPLTGVTGFDLGQYECDDGNNADFDGCNSFCQIETGFICIRNGQQVDSEILCEKYEDLNAEVLEISFDNKLVKLGFNKDCWFVGPDILPIDDLSLLMVHRLSGQTFESGPDFTWTIEMPANYSGKFSANDTFAVHID